MCCFQVHWGVCVGCVTSCGGGCWLALLLPLNRPFHALCQSQSQSQVIAEGLKSGSVNLDNPNVRTLLEACAAAGIGTTGLNTKSLIKKSSGEGGRKSPSVGGKKSTSPSGPKKAPPAKGTSTTTTTAPASGDASGGGGSGKKKTPSAETPTANGVGGGEKKAKGDGNANGTKPDASKVLPKSPKSPSGGDAANSKGKRTPSKTVGKPGLALPTTLFPELVQMIDQGGESYFCSAGKQGLPVLLAETDSPCLISSRLIEHSLSWKEGLACSLAETFFFPCRT